MAMNGTGVEIFLYKYHDTTASGELRQKLDLIGVVEDFISMIFTRSWTDVGQWEIVMPNESDKITLFKLAQFIKLHDKACGFINQEETVIDEESNTTTFKGSELKGLVDLRIINPNSFTGDYVYGPVGVLKKRLIDENIVHTSNERTIPSVIPSQDIEFYAGDNISYHPVYAELGQVIRDLSSSTDTGWYADIQYYAHVVYPSRNRLIWAKDVEDQTKVNTHTGKYIDAQGVAVESTGNAYTDFIYVTAGSELYFYGMHNGTESTDIRVHGYSDDNESAWVQLLGLVSNVEPNTEYEIHIDVPANVQYIRCSFVEDDEDVMLEYAPKTSYTQYQEPVYDTGYAIEWKPSTQGVDCTKDRTQTQLEAADEPLIISYNLDNMLNSTLTKVRYLPNVAYVAGQGEGRERTIAIVDEHDKTGIDRFESLIDARDLSDETALPQRGLEYLAQYGTNISYICEASNALLTRYTYTPWYWDDPDKRSTYDDSVEIGNYGTFVDDITDFECDFQITSITEVYEEDGFRLELQFGHDANNLNDNLSILSSRTQGILNSDPAQGEPSEIYLKYWLGIKDGVAPTLKLLPSDTFEELYAGELGITGNFDGYLSIFAKNEKDSDVNSRMLKLYDSSAEADINNALKLTDVVDGVSTDYDIIHSGNISNYATSFQPSSVSGAITWDTTHVNTASGLTSYVILKLGNIRLFRFKIVLKSALTATATIGTISSGNRPNTTIYGTACTLSSATNDVRVVGLNSSGGIVMWNNTKASTYYGTIVYFV